MDICVICDCDFSIKDFVTLSQLSTDTITFFPLTSNFILLDEIRKKLENYGVVVEVNTAQLINDEVPKFRDELLEWSHEMGETSVFGKTIKERLLTPDKGVSTWWFSQLSEKNNIQTDAFFKLIQLEAIQKFIFKNNTDYFVISISDNRLKKGICTFLKNNFKKFKVIRPEKNSDRTSLLENAKNIFQSTFFGNILVGFARYYKLYVQWKNTKKILGSPEKRILPKNELLFISYYPAVEKESAEKGILRNKFYLPLQELCNEKKIPITWLMMPVPYDGYDFNDALHLTKKFVDAGENIFILQEFLSFYIFAKATSWWLRQAIISPLLFYFFRKRAMKTNIASKEKFHIIKQLWRQSFIGPIGQIAILHYLNFEKVFKDIPNIYTCIYYAEMQSWEKAMCAAKKKVSPSINLIGFQHAALGKNHFRSFYSKNDLAITGKPFDMPLPYLMVSNGKIPNELLSLCNYPNLTIAESVRYLWLEKILNQPYVEKKYSNKILICGSINKVETKAILSMAYMASKELPEFEIYLKGHPSLPIEELLLELKITTDKFKYEIVHESLQTVLKKVSMVLIADGTAAFEALAFNCKIVVAVFSEMMVLSSLNDTDGFCDKVSSVNELVDALKSQDDMHEPGQFEKNRKFIHQYWELNLEMSKWRQILNI